MRLSNPYLERVGRFNGGDLVVGVLKIGRCGYFHFDGLQGVGIINFIFGGALVVDNRCHGLGADQAVHVVRPSLRRHDVVVAGDAACSNVVLRRRARC